MVDRRAQNNCYRKKISFEHYNIKNNMTQLIFRIMLKFLTNIQKRDP